MVLAFSQVQTSRQPHLAGTAPSFRKNQGLCHQEAPPYVTIAFMPSFFERVLSEWCQSLLGMIMLSLHYIFLYAIEIISLEIYLLKKIYILLGRSCLICKK